VAWFCVRAGFETRFGKRWTALGDLIAATAMGLGMCASMIGQEITDRSNLVWSLDSTMAAIHMGQPGLASAVGLRDQLNHHRLDLLVDGPLLLLVGLVIGGRIQAFWTRYCRPEATGRGELAHGA
jgi:hypothetical protein